MDAAQRFSLWDPNDQQRQQPSGIQGRDIYGGLWGQNSVNPGYVENRFEAYTIPRFQQQLETLHETAQESSRFDSMRTNGLGRGSMSQPTHNTAWTSQSTPAKPAIVTPKPERSELHLPSTLTQLPASNLAEQSGGRRTVTAQPSVVIESQRTSGKVQETKSSSAHLSKTQSIRMWVGQVAAPLVALPSFYPKQLQFQQYRKCNPGPIDVENTVQPQKATFTSTANINTGPQSFHPVQYAPASQLQSQQISSQASVMAYDAVLKPAVESRNPRRGWNWRFVSIVFIFVMMVIGGVGAAVGTISSAQGAATLDLTSAPTTNAPSFAPTLSPNNPIVTSSPTINKGDDDD